MCDLFDHNIFAEILNYTKGRNRRNFIIALQSDKRYSPHLPPFDHIILIDAETIKSISRARAASIKKITIFCNKSAATSLYLFDLSSFTSAEIIELIGNNIDYETLETFAGSKLKRIIIMNSTENILNIYHISRRILSLVREIYYCGNDINTVKKIIAEYCKRAVLIECKNNIIRVRSPHFAASGYKNKGAIIESSEKTAAIDPAFRYNANKESKRRFKIELAAVFETEKINKIKIFPPVFEVMGDDGSNKFSAFPAYLLNAANEISFEKFIMYDYWIVNQKCGINFGKAEWPHLVKLSLSECRISYKLPPMSQLRELVINNCSSSVVKTITRDLPNIAKLSLTQMPRLVDYSFLRHLSSIKTLKIEDCGHFCFEYIAAYLPNLEKIIIGRNVDVCGHSSKIPANVYVKFLPDVGIAAYGGLIDHPQFSLSKKLADGGNVPIYNISLLTLGGCGLKNVRKNLFAEMKKRTRGVESYNFK